MDLQVIGMIGSQLGLGTLNKSPDLRTDGALALKHQLGVSTQRLVGLAIHGT